MKIIANLDNLDLVVDNIQRNGIYILQGDLASGKTTLVKHICKKIISKDASSPTFSVMNKYEDDDFCIYHYDIYQNGYEGLLNNGLIENLFEDGLHLVEWGDDKLIRTLLNYGLEVNIIKITNINEAREYEFIKA